MYSFRPAREQLRQNLSRSSALNTIALNFSSDNLVKVQTLLSSNSSTSECNILSVNSQDEDYNSEVEKEGDIADISLEEDQHLNLLKYFESALFATIIEDAIIALRILSECNSHLTLYKTMADIKNLQNLKYNIELPTVFDELHAINSHKLGASEYKLNKLFNDRKRMTDLLTDVYINLSINTSFKPLIKEINIIMDSEKCSRQLMECEAKNKSQSQELRKKLRMQRIQHKSAIYDTDVGIEELRTKIEDTEIMGETTCRYVGYWQQARSEQCDLAIREKESALSARTEEFKTRHCQEQMVHSEIALLNSIIVNETRTKVEQIMVKYDRDMDEIDLKIQVRRKEYCDMLNKAEILQKKLIENGKELNDWKLYKEERQKAQDYRDMMNASAITVQAWWRGLLVRQQLGPYRPKRRTFAKNKTL